jgi:hypothetical protein
MGIAWGRTPKWRQTFTWSERDRIERAVMDLAGIGLLHRHDFLNRPDSLVTPTQAALDEYENEDD